MASGLHLDPQRSRRRRRGQGRPSCRPVRLRRYQGLRPERERQLHQGRHRERRRPRERQVDEDHVPGHRGPEVDSRRSAVRVQGRPTPGRADRARHPARTRLVQLGPPACRGHASGRHDAVRHDDRPPDHDLPLPGSTDWRPEPADGPYRTLYRLSERLVHAERIANPRWRRPARVTGAFRLAWSVPGAVAVSNSVTT